MAASTYRFHPLRMTTVYASTKPATADNPLKTVNEAGTRTQIHLTRRSPAYWRVTIDNPPINVMGPEMVRQFQEVIADLDAFVEALATRIAGFDKWAIANTKRLVNTRLPPDVELGAGWDACIASLGRPAAQDGIKTLMARGFHKPGDVENRLGYYLGQITR